MSKKYIIVIIVVVCLSVGAYLLFRKRKNDYIEDIKTLPSAMKTSTKGKDFIKKKEGLTLVPKWDVKQWSIGYGHSTGSIKWTIITKDIANKFFEEDILKQEKKLANDIKVDISQGVYDLLISMYYNMGSLGSGLIGLINSKADTEAIKSKVMEYVNAGGKPNSGLIARRKAEIETFLT